MGVRMTRRRVIGALVVAAGRRRRRRRASRCASPRRTPTARDRGKKAPVALEFAPGRPRRASRRSRCRAGCRCRGRCSRSARRPSRPRSPATSARSPCAKARRCRPGQVLGAHRHRRPRGEADRAARARSRSARAQLALAEKTPATNQTLLKQNFISQNAFDNSESSFNVAQGSVKSAEAQVQLAQNALQGRRRRPRRSSGIVAKRHVQPGEKVAFDAPLVTVVDLDGARAAGAGAGGRRARSSRSACRSSSRSTASASAGSPGASSASTRRPSRARARSWSTSASRNADAALRGGMFATGRIALAAGAPVPTLPPAAVRTEAGQTFVWAIDGRQARRAASWSSAAATTRPGRVEIKTALPRGAAGARRALRQPEGRRAGAGQGAASSRRTRERRRRRRVGAAAQRRRLTPATPDSDPAMWITRVSINNPVFATMVMVGIAVLGLFSYKRLRVEQMPDVSLPFVLVLTQYPGRVAGGGRDRRHQAARVRDQHGLRRQADPLELARGPEPGVRRVPARHRHDAGDAGRARQGRAGAARLPARRQGSAGRSAPTTRTSSRWCRSR